ncbi:MAG TPA: hypothetical protein PK861_01220 [Thermomonas sp.]|nr:hypothetical protein [Thermomonas sp.]
MAFNDNFTNGTGSGQNLGARSGWTFGAGGVGDAFVSAGNTYLSSSPSGESYWTCTSQGSADHYTEAVMRGLGGFVCIRLTDANNFIGFRHDGTSWQVYKRVAGTFTQLGSDYTAALAGGEVCRLTGNGNTITFTINGTQRCLGTGVTETAHNTVVAQGVVTRTPGSSPWIDDFTAAPNTAAPVLSAPTATATGPTQATIGVTTDTAPTSTAISYQILPAATGAPSAATIVGAPDGTIATGSVGALTKAITGLTTNAAVKVHFAQGTSSNVVSSASFTPSTLAWSGTYPAQSGTAGAAFVHSGSVPSPTGGIGTKSYSATGLGASGLTMNSSTGQLQGTCGTAGTYTVTPTVTDQSTAGSPAPQTAALASFTLTIAASGDTTPPTMSAASVTGGTLSATGSITSNEAGTLWWKMDGSATAADPGAGNESGAGWTSQSMTASANAVNFGTQPAGTRYGHFIGVDAAGNRAAVVNASGTVSAGGGGLATSVSITLTTDGTTPAANLTGLKVAVFDQATPDLWAGHAPIYATSAATTNGSGVLTCSIAGLTTLAPGALAGLVVSNSDGTLTQGAAQKGYVGPALVS